MIKPLQRFFFHMVIVVPTVGIVFLLARQVYHGQVRTALLGNLEVRERLAELKVVKSEMDERTGKIFTTVSLAEFHADGRKLPPRFLTFHGGTLHLQTITFEFKDVIPELGEKIKGRVAHLFFKVFTIEGEKIKQLVLSDAYQVPQGYATGRTFGGFEEELWRVLWGYALDPERKKPEMIRNGQIVAGSGFFFPGTGYILRINREGELKVAGPMKVGGLVG